ncbi:MAG TPA: condensation domain-containing protein, partial [Vicinamibacteria bacterium]
MVPSEFIVLDALPRTPSGKVDRNALPASEGRRPDLGEPYVPPRTLEEEKLARVWSAVLGIERVGIHDNFFLLGGDSILSIQIVSRALQENLVVTPQQLFQHQTVAELALVAGTRPRVEAPQGEVAGPVPLTPIQRWFFDQERPEPHYFNQALFLHLSRPLEARHLRAAVLALLAHHDALRLRAQRGPSGWSQRIVPFAAQEADHSFLSVDLRELGPEEARGPLAATGAQLQASLDLPRGPILRCAHFRIGDGSERVLLAVHHLAIDGVSWRVLLEDLYAGYQQSLAGERIQLPPKTTSFQQWARRLEAHASSKELLSEASHWLEVCRPEAPIATDREGDNDFASTATVAVLLDAPRTQALIYEVPAAYRTQVGDVLLAALARAFSSWAGRDSMLVNLEGHGREELFPDFDLSRTVGWFTTIFPVRLTLDRDGAEDEGRCLMSIKEQLRRVPRRGIGHGLLRYLSGDRELSRKLASEAPIS